MTKSRKNKQNWSWDPWQQEVMDHQGNITIRAGRQVGKSEVVSAKAVKFATENPDTTTLIIAASQRQSSLLFEKVRSNIDRLERHGADLYAERPTKTRMVLKNGAKIYSLPAGRTGYFIRGFTIDMLIADEAAYIPETVWNAVIPMIAVSRKKRGFGFIILLSTPFGKGGYFYSSFTDDDFKQFHASSEDCDRIPPEFLSKERQRLSKAEYMQEYLGEFTDEWNQFFKTDLIKKQMTFIEWTMDNDYKQAARYYLGVDFARYGGDENAFVILEHSEDLYKVVKVIATERVTVTDTIGRIQVLHNLYSFRKIFIDDGGLGGPILDILQEKLGRIVVGLNNASRRVQVQGEEKRRGILKQDLYNNALMMLEAGHLELISDLKLLKSLKSITFEYGSTQGKSRNLRIFGNYSHITEAMVRACWSLKEKGLDLYIF